MTGKAMIARGCMFSGKMKKLLLLILLLLTACMPSDPYSMQAAASGMLQGTQAAQYAQRQQAENEQLRAQANATAAAAPLVATQTAFIIQATQAAYSIQTTQTADAYAAQIRSATETAVAEYLGRDATATAQVVQAEALQRAENGRMIRNVFLMLFATGAGLMTLFAFYSFLVRLLDTIIEQREANNRIKFDRNGRPIIYLSQHNIWIDSEQIARLYRLQDILPGLRAAQLEPVNRQIVDAIAKPEPHRTPIHLLNDAIRFAQRTEGWNMRQLPGNRLLPGWNAQAWQDCVDELKARGLVDTSNQGTFCAIGTIEDLRAEILPHPTPPLVPLPAEWNA